MDSAVPSTSSSTVCERMPPKRRRVVDKAEDAARKREARKKSTPEAKAADAARKKRRTLEAKAAVALKMRIARQKSTPEAKAADAARKKRTTLEAKAAVALKKRVARQQSTPEAKGADAARKKRATPEAKAAVAVKKRVARQQSTPEAKAADAARKKRATPEAKAAVAVKKRIARQESTPETKAADLARKKRTTPSSKAALALRKQVARQQSTPEAKAAEVLKKRVARQQTTPDAKAADAIRKRAARQLSSHESKAADAAKQATPMSRAQNRESHRRCSERSKSSYVKLLTRYMKMIIASPSLICSCCGGLWYEESTTVTSPDILYQKGCSSELILKVLYVSQTIHRLCGTCRNSVYKQKIPKLCLSNGFDFPPIPIELQELSPLEERLVALRLPFMQIRLIGSERQSLLRGNVVNVENDLDVCAEVLPRKFDDTSIVQVQLMRRMKYQSPYMYESIRPMKVYNAAKFLVSTELYISHNVAFCDEWRLFNQDDTLDFICEQSDSPPIADTNDDSDSDSDNDDSSHALNEKVNLGADETLIYRESDSSFSGIRIAPCEGKTPIPLFQDSNAEEMSFPTIYAGVARKFKNPKVTYTDIAKSELRRFDRRACRPSKILYSFKRSYNEKVHQAVQICMRKTCGSQSLTAGNLRMPGCIESLLKKDEGYAVFKNIRSSPLYWRQKTKSVLAMVRQLGKCTFFITLSAAETKWTELLIMLMKILKNKEITEEEAKQLTFQEISDLISSDPVTCMRHFDHRYRALLNTLFKPAAGIFAPYMLRDHFSRLEFQMRGSPHSHGLYWVQDAPVYVDSVPNSATACIQFIDSYITCDRNEEGEMANLIGYQMHKHTATCKKKARRGVTCRFGFPKPPLPQTMILKPLEEDELTTGEWQEAKYLFTRIQEKLNEFGRSFKDDIPYEAFLQSLETVHVNYLIAIRSSIQRTTVFLKRSTNAAFINGYNRCLLEAWRANVDVQFVLDTYACAKYCVGYILKSDGGVSKLLQAANKDTRRGNVTIKEKLRKFANVLINGSEISAQEAAAFLLGIPNTACSRIDVFINTAPPDQRIRMLKSKEELDKLDDGCSDVVASGLNDHYLQRPDELECVCLAEFASLYEFRKSNTKNRKSKNQPTLTTECIEDTETHDKSGNEEDDSTPLKLLDGSGFLKKRLTRKIIRFRHYGKNDDPENYCREQLMLFLPWREEEDELLSINATEKYKQWSTEVFTNSEPFYYDREIDDLILENLANESDLDASDIEDEGTYPNNLDLIEEDDFFEADVFEDSNRNDKRFEHFRPPKLISEEDYLRIMRTLSEKQRRFVMNTLHLLKTSSDPFYSFLSGGAGVGKSHAVTAIVQSFMRFNNKFPTTHSDDICCLVAAPTGKAAFNVFGMTLHCSFKLPPNQSCGKLSNLDSSALNSLRVKLIHVKLFIIDEISMVSVRQLYDIDQRLRQIFDSPKDFGGKSVIVVGHLRQLAPVAGTYVFKPPKHLHFGLCVGNHLWEKFSLFELDEIMRQKGEWEFCKALNNMAEGAMDEDDIKLIKSREVSESNMPPDNAINLFSTNEECRDFNNKVHEKLKTDGALSVAFDRIQGTGSEKQKKALLDYAKRLTPQQSDGIPYSVQLKIDGEYFVSTNVDVADGLFNGSTGCLKLIEYGTTHEHERIPIRCWMDFRTPLIGASKRRLTHSRQIMKQINVDWTAIDRFTRNLSKTGRHKGLEIVRTQIPLVAANGMTITKSQGSSLPTVVVSVKRFRLSNGRLTRKLTRELLYVACSRATSLKGLFIDGCFEPPHPPPWNDPVTIEMDRLRRTPFQFSLQFLQDFSEDYFKIYFQNIQSFAAHVADIHEDHCALASDFLALVEPHLLKSDEVTFSNYDCIHRSNCRKIRNSEGAVVFAKAGSHSTQVHVDYSTIGHCLFVEWVVSGMNLIVVYKSPKYSTLDFFTQLANVIQNKQGNILLFGDFNINLQEDNGKRLINFLQKYNLETKLNVENSSTDGGTHIDCCFSNNRDVIAWFYETYNSYHKAVCIAWPRRI